MEIQQHYQTVMDNRILEMQNETTAQVNRFQMQQRDLKELLEDQLQSLERDYIKRSHYNEMMQQKRNEYEKMKQTAQRREEEYRSDLEAKLSFTESRLNQEYENSLNFLKETELGDQKNINKNMENIISTLQQTEKAFASYRGEMEVRVNYLEQQRKEKANKIEKQSQKLEDQSNSIKQYDALCKSLQEELNHVREQLNQNNKENENLSKRLSQIIEENEELNDRLQQEQSEGTEMRLSLQEIKRSSEHTIRFQEESISNLQESLEEVQSENKKLNERLFEAMKDRNSSMSDERRKIEQLQNDLAQSEAILRTKQRENDTLNKKVDQQQSVIIQSKQEINNLNIHISEIEQIFQDNQVHVREIEKRLFRQEKSIQQFQYTVRMRVQTEFLKLRKENDALKNFATHAVEIKQNESNLWINTLVSQFREILTQRDAMHGQQMSELKLNLQQSHERDLRQFDFQLKEKNLGVDTQAQTELAQLRQYCQRLSQSNQQMMNEFRQAQGDHQTFQQKNGQLQRENHKLRKQLQKTIEQLEIHKQLVSQKEKGKLDAKDHEIKQYEAKLVKLRERYQKIKTETLSFASDVSRLRQEHETTLFNFQQKFEIKEVEHRQELFNILENKQQEIAALHDRLEDYEKLNSSLKDDIVGQSEKIQQLLNSLRSRENDIFQVQSQFEQQVYQLKQALSHQELEGKLEIEEVRKQYKLKDEEAIKVQHQITQLEKEIQQFQIKLQQANDQKNQYINRYQELQQQMDSRNVALETQSKELAEQQGKQNQEIEDLHQLLTQSFKTINNNSDSVRLAKKLDQDTQELTQKVKDLQKINKYLENSRSPPNQNNNSSQGIPTQPFNFSQNYHDLPQIVEEDQFDSQKTFNFLNSNINNHQYKN